MIKEWRATLISMTPSSVKNHIFVFATFDCRIEDMLNSRHLFLHWSLWLLVIFVITFPLLSHGVGHTVITDCSELQNISSGLSGTYELGNDISCAGGSFTTIGSSGSPFTGTLDGKGYVISGLYISGAGQQGLFGGTNGATIHDLYITEAHVTCSSTSCGVLVGNPASTTIYNVGISDFTVTSTSSYVGGVTGLTYITTLNRVFTSSGTVTGTSTVGGIAGWLQDSSLLDGWSEATVTGGSTVGGVAGYLYSSSVSSSVTRSYAHGSVSGTTQVGGLVGYVDFDSLFGTQPCSVNDSYATGNVTGTVSPGGLVGTKFASCSVNNSFYDNHAGNPSSCVGVNGGGTTVCTAISDNESYFYDSGNQPMSSWNFTSIWVRTLSHALLRWADTSTQAPVLTSPASSSSSPTPLTVTYSLPEYASGGTVSLNFNDGGSKNITLTLNNATGSSFSLDLNNPTASSQVVSSSSGSIPSGTYTVTLSYRDTVNNAAASAISTNVSLSNDATTESPTLVSPADNTTHSGFMQVTYSLPEAPLANSVHLDFGAYSLTMNDSTSANFVLNTQAVTASSQVTAATVSAIPFGTYNATLRYQDAASNPQASAVATNIVIRTAPDSLTIEPSSDSTGGGGGGRGGSRGGSSSHFAAPGQQVPTEEDERKQEADKEQVSVFELRVCNRVDNRFSNLPSVLKRVNERLMRRFGFSC